MQPITTAIYSAIKPYGALVHEGFQVRCAGTTDADGNVTRHLICTLDSHLPGTQAHAWNNPEMVDSLWIMDPSQVSIDWTSPKCQICNQEIAP